MNNLQFRRLLYAMASLPFIWSACGHATTLSLASQPLVVSGTVDPNVMLLLDNSGSMSNIVPEPPFDENTDYMNCSATYSITPDADLHVDIKIQAGGDAYFNWDETDYDFGNDSSTGITGRNKRCFNDNDTYNARLFGDSGETGELKLPASYIWSQFKGNFLNWYLSDASISDGANFGVDARQRPGTKTRMEIAKAAAYNLVGGLNNVRMGLATYDSSGVGGRIIEGIDDISSNKAALQSSISALTNDGATPIAETLETLGRYFVQGHETADITVHPGSVSGTEATLAANALFSHSPSYVDSGDTPTTLDPVIQYFCQKNFIIALTDGRPQSDQEVDTDLADYDGDCVSASPACGSFDQKDSSLGYAYESEGSDYLDDVTLALNEIDLRPDLDKADGTEELNNIITHLIGFADDQVINDPLLQDAADNGGGQLLTANSSSDLADIFASVTEGIFAQVGSVASVAFNSSQLSSGSAVFQAQFNTARWSGNLLAFPLSSTGVIGAQAWDAAVVLDSLLLSERKIFSYSTITNEGIEFAWANLSTAQKADLYQGVDSDGDGISMNVNGVSDDDDAQLLINYLLGDNSLEGTSTNRYRIRDSRLGDIVNSTPVFVGKPALSWPDFSVNSKFGASSDNYSTFKAGSAATRTPLIYVGANDGMLHGFNAEISSANKGKELMAYIPGAISSTAANKGLHYLADTQYTHEFYVDLTPAVSDVYIKRDTAGSKAWRTVLLGGLRAGGRGFFALDVTDPAEFSNPASNAGDVVLWEFTNADNADLGFTYSQPTMVMMANGKWAAIFGNGYNSDDDRAILFIVFLEEGIDGAWASTDYVKIYTDTIASPNGGLSTPRVVDLDADSVADRVYAGDLNGNMWVFDVTDIDPANWDVAYKAAVSPFAPEPLFTAVNASSQPQPITTAPILAKNTSNVNTLNSNEPNVLVLFGSGRFIEPSDVSSYTDVMSYYAVWDAQTSLLTRSDLIPRTLSTSGSLRTVTGSAIDWTTDHGWYMDLPATGERVVSDSSLRRDVLFFNTIIPDTVPCSAGGSGWLMSLEFDTGLAPAFAIFDKDEDGDIDTDDIGYVGRLFEHGVPARSGILGEKQYTPGSEGTIEERDIYVGKGGREGRLSWQEMFRDY